MRRRLYYVLPNIKSAQTMMNELLLARVGANHIHFIAKSDNLLGNLPKANFLERSGAIYCGEIGLCLGAGLGLLGGILAVNVPQWFGDVPLTIIPYCVVIGAIASALWTGTLATAIPNNKVDSFRKQINRGSVLMIVSMPFYRVREIRNLLSKTHPETAYAGVWPAEHVLFP